MKNHSLTIGICLGASLILSLFFTFLWVQSGGNKEFKNFIFLSTDVVTFLLIYLALTARKFWVEEEAQEEDKKESQKEPEKS